MSEERGSPAERALWTVLDEAGQGALHFEGTDRKCVRASPGAATLLGQPLDSLIGASRAAILDALVPADDPARAALQSLRDVAGPDLAQQLLLLALDASKQGGAQRALRWISAPTEGGRVDLLIDRTAEREQAEELARLRLKLAETSTVDDLTGLANRRHFELEIDREHRRSQRAWASYAVARIDIDGMAPLNAELGRDVGDKLLRRVGEELRVARREYDLVARWESDELIVLLPGIDSAAVKTVLARSLGAMRDAARAIVGRDVTFSVGVALWIPPSVEAASDIVSRAGTALEAAKLLGPGSVEIDDSMVDWRDDTGSGHQI